MAWIGLSVIAAPKNISAKTPTFGAIENVNLTGVQWKCLALGVFEVNFSKYNFFLSWGELIFGVELRGKIRWSSDKPISNNDSLSTIIWHSGKWNKLSLDSHKASVAGPTTEIKLTKYDFLWQPPDHYL